MEQVDGSSQITIKSTSGKEHTVKFTNDENMPECTYKNWTHWHIPCKHFFTVFNHFEKWGWTNLPKKYLKNEYLTANSALLTNPSNGSSDPSFSSSPAPGDLDGEETVGITDELPQHKVTQ